MNSNLLFDFTVDKTTNTINVRREFDADTDLVWKAWTTSELLDQWWAPKPYRSLTKSMDGTGCAPMWLLSIRSDHVCGSVAQGK